MVKFLEIMHFHFRVIVNKTNIMLRTIRSGPEWFNDIVIQLPILQMDLVHVTLTNYA